MARELDNDQVRRQIEDEGAYAYSCYVDAMVPSPWVRGGETKVRASLSVLFVRLSMVAKQLGECREEVEKVGEQF